MSSESPTPTPHTTLDPSAAKPISHPLYKVGTLALKSEVTLLKIPPVSSKWLQVRKKPRKWATDNALSSWKQAYCEDSLKKPRSSSFLSLWPLQELKPACISRLSLRGLCGAPAVASGKAHVPDVAIVGGITHVSAEVFKHFLGRGTAPGVEDLRTAHPDHAHQGPGGQRPQQG